MNRLRSVRGWSRACAFEHPDQLAEIVDRLTELRSPLSRPSTAGGLGPAR